MRVFELYFNPKTKEDRIFDSFIYEPENLYEKRLGGLYIVGELTQALPQNSHFLDRLASTIKKEYYSGGLKKSCEMSLRDALKKANEFLEEEARKGNVSWLGNLNFTVLNSKDFILNFTKVGSIKILLTREEELLNIGENLEFQDINPYPLKIFGSIATGKLAPNDKIMILTKDIFSAFGEKGDLLNQFAKSSNERGLNEILKNNREKFSQISGVCLLLIADEEQILKQALTFRAERPKFSFRRVFLNPLRKIVSKTPHFKLKLPAFKFTLRFFPKIKFPILKSPRLYKNGGLVLALILILAASFFLFGNEKKENFAEAQHKLDEARAKIIMAENFLILKEENKARTLFQEARDIIIPLTEVGMPLRDEARTLQESIEKYLNSSL